MTMLVKKAFISSEFIPSVSLCPLPWAFLFSRVLRKKDFPIKQKRGYLLNFFRKYPLHSAVSIKLWTKSSSPSYVKLCLTMKKIGQKLVKTP